MSACVCVSGLPRSSDHTTLSGNHSHNDSAVDGCGFLPLRRDNSQPHLVYTIRISKEMAFSFQLEHMELVIAILEQMLLHHDHGSYCAFP